MEGSTFFIAWSFICKFKKDSKMVITYMYGEYKNGDEHGQGYHTFPNGDKY